MFGKKAKKRAKRQAQAQAQQTRTSNAKVTANNKYQMDKLKYQQASQNRKNTAMSNERKYNSDLTASAKSKKDAVYAERQKVLKDSANLTTNFEAQEKRRFLRAKSGQGQVSANDNAITDQMREDMQAKANLGSDYWNSKAKGAYDAAMKAGGGLHHTDWAHWRDSVRGPQDPGPGGSAPGSKSTKAAGPVSKSATTNKIVKAKQGQSGAQGYGVTKNPALAGFKQGRGGTVKYNGSKAGKSTANKSSNPMFSGHKTSGMFGGNSAGAKHTPASPKKAKAPSRTPARTAHKAPAYKAPKKGKAPTRTPAYKAPTYKAPKKGK